MTTVTYLVGALALIGVWLLFALIGGTRNPWKLIEGADGQPSTSKLQWLAWTVVVIFSYAAIYTARALRGDYSTLNNFPHNLIIVIGFSITTMAAAKGITVSQLSKGKITKSQVPAGQAKANAIINDDGGYPDLSKMQMLAWTLVTIGVFLTQVVSEIHGAAMAGNAQALAMLKLPDIDSTLMALMGLGQGAYLAKKAVSTT